MKVKSKVLIIDSHESTRTFMRFVLVNAGHRVVAAKTGEQALELVEDELFDLALIDLHLPDMDGYDLIKQIRAITTFGDKPILAVSPLYKNEDLQQVEAIPAGIDLWITQPVAPQKLVKMIKDLGIEMEDDDFTQNV